MASTEVKIFSKPKKVFKGVAKEILKLTQLSQQERFDIALPGGNTPKKLFIFLGEDYKNVLPWKRIHFWWGDERCVSPDSNQSNFKLAFDNLFSHIDIPKENIHRIQGENIPVDEVFRYTAEIEENLIYRGDTPVFDLVILGLGEDGRARKPVPGRRGGPARAVR